MSKSAHVAHATSFRFSALSANGAFVTVSSRSRQTRLSQNAAQSAPLDLYSIPHRATLLSLIASSAIMSRNVLNLLRSATSSMSPLAVTRSYHPTYRRAVLYSRSYLGTTSEKANGSADKIAEDKQDAVPPPLPELETKLKAKEDEVLDLTVSPSRWLIY